MKGNSLIYDRTLCLLLLLSVVFALCCTDMCGRTTLLNEIVSISVMFRWNPDCPSDDVWFYAKEILFQFVRSFSYDFSAMKSDRSVIKIYKG